MGQRRRQRNINGLNGQTGALQQPAITGDYTISEQDAGQTLLVTAEATITLPVGDDGPGPGFFCEVVRMGADAVDFVGGLGATVVSSSGATPAIAAQYQGASVTRLDNDVAADTWLVIGALA